MSAIAIAKTLKKTIVSRQARKGCIYINSNTKILYENNLHYFNHSYLDKRVLGNDISKSVVALHYLLLINLWKRIKMTAIKEIIESIEKLFEKKQDIKLLKFRITISNCARFKEWKTSLSDARFRTIIKSYTVSKIT